MKVVVIGGTGLIGSKLLTELAAHGHEAVSASPNSGVDTLTGVGLAEVVTGADVVVDVSNSPSFADDAVLDSSRGRRPTSSPPKPPRGSDTTSACPSSAPSDSPTVDTCGPRSRRKR